DRSLIESGDPDNASQNDIRAQILGAYRGYGNDAVLFKNFPRDTKWRRVVFDDVSRLKHVGSDAFIKLTRGTRSVMDSAANYRSSPQTAVKVDKIIQEIANGVPMEDLVLVENAQKDLVIIEGNHRAIAYVLTKRRDRCAFVGTSPSIQDWDFI